MTHCPHTLDVNRVVCTRLKGAVDKQLALPRWKAHAATGHTHKHHYPLGEGQACLQQTLWCYRFLVAASA